MTFADEIAAWAENPQQIKLQLGELTAGELRTAQAVARMFAGKARGMTDNLSDRERKLVEDDLAAIGFKNQRHLPQKNWTLLATAESADDSPNKRYTMPTWTNFVSLPHAKGMDLNHQVPVDITTYNAIREALAKEET